jgi:hypothetical protein
MAVPEEHVPMIQAYFQKLSPYDFDEQLFKLENENFLPDTKTPEPLYFLGISSKRYVLFNEAKGKISIRKHSGHGLGHLLDPFGRGAEEEKWQREWWLDILGFMRGEIGEVTIDSRYEHLYAISRMTVSKPTLLNRFKTLNSMRLPQEQIKPFNFFFIGQGCRCNRETGKKIQPMVSYSNTPQDCPHGEFIDFSTGEKMTGLEYWRSLDEVFWDYLFHPEAKFLCESETKGVLHRRHLTITGVTIIGKESNNLELTPHTGLDEEAYTIMRETPFWKDPEFQLMLRQVRGRDAHIFGLSRMQLARMRGNLELGLKPFDTNKVQRKARNLFKAWKKVRSLEPAYDECSRVEEAEDSVV